MWPLITRKLSINTNRNRNSKAEMWLLITRKLSINRNRNRNCKDDRIIKIDYYTFTHIKARVYQHGYNEDRKK